MLIGSGAWSQPPYSQSRGDRKRVLTEARVSALAEQMPGDQRARQPVSLPAPEEKCDTAARENNTGVQAGGKRCHFWSPNLASIHPLLSTAHRCSGPATTKPVLGNRAFPPMRGQACATPEGGSSQVSLVTERLLFSKNSLLGAFSS